jgi:hypothetical protein
MNRDKVLAMAKEAGLTSIDKKSAYLQDCLDRLVHTVIESEREACAQLTEQMGIDGYGTLAIAVAIRARGQQ